MSVRTTRSGRVYATPEVKQHRQNKDDSSFTKSARKKLALFDSSIDMKQNTLTDELVLEEIFKLSPVSPVKRCKENIVPKASNCRCILSPLRSLTLNSPPSTKGGPALSISLQNQLQAVLLASPPSVNKSSPKVLKSPQKRSLPENNNVLTNGNVTPLNDATNASPKKVIQKFITSSPSPSKKTKLGQSSGKPRRAKSVQSPAKFTKAILQDKFCNKENIPPFQLRKKDNLYNKVKSALHNAVPDQLVGRDPELSEISSFVTNHIASGNAGSLYISGAPGTGKSACLVNVLSNEKICKKLDQVITINCMSMRTAQQIYQRVAYNMGATSRQLKSARLAQKFIEQKLIEPGKMKLLLLDEMDQLESKHQEVLYTMFDWASITNSKLILIGIANSLDLTDRILPRLQANVECKPHLINFKPYSKDQLVQILQARIKKASEHEENDVSVVDTVAVQFCARKVAAMTGDARKALEVCRRAVEMVERKHSKQTLSPSKASSKKVLKVGLMQISDVLSGVYESNNFCARSNNDNETDNDDAFPLQQKLVVCSLFLLCKTSKTKEASLGKLHESYSTICKRRHVPSVGQSEFVSLCGLVESRGIISVKKAKQMRQTKIKLNMQEKDVEFALQGKALLSSILQMNLS
ncbi:unnamed protein product [Clavelina lepadiformis]|uniref:Cell division control protein n=1 Tax=Clavelina lepadiformis TaxID=159417 RepID=A0ABP0F5V1_CLALP